VHEETHEFHPGETVYRHHRLKLLCASQAIWKETCA
jgi:hypothetical protein